MTDHTHTHTHVNQSQSDACRNAGKGSVAPVEVPREVAERHAHTRTCSDVGRDGRGCAIAQVGGFLAARGIQGLLFELCDQVLQPACVRKCACGHIC